jgi:hypothetical protein
MAPHRSPADKPVQGSGGEADVINMQRNAVLFVLALTVAGCGPGAGDGGPADGSATPNSTTTAPPASAGPADWTPRAETRDGLEGVARTEGEQLVLQTAGGERTFLPGVNLGATIPGRFPGEQAIRAEDFRRWFPQMRDLGFRVVRVYTIMPPSFYAELLAFNQANPSSPMYLVHGVWVPQAGLETTEDLYSPQVTDEFTAEMARAVAVVNGDTELPEVPGLAGGIYTADVSDWLVSWLVGVEWDPLIIQASDAKNSSVAPFQGKFFVSRPGASPTETWLARMLDHLATIEADRGHTMPLAFVNWPTTDPLEHPDEPVHSEDLVAIDANNLVPTAAWPGGYYASYHAYPYYPDFQRYEVGVADFQHKGQTDAYAGYLTKLARHHEGIPLVISEFGVPSGMAHAHFGPQGRNQGGHTEQEQMAINAELVDVISEVGLAGGFVFEWTDEWFKFTWNTVDFELPWERRALWSNPWTNEAHFGVLATEPGEAPVVIIDGDDSEWLANGSQVILESDTGVREVRAVKDEAYLHLLIRTDEAEAWQVEPIVIGLDVLTGSGGGAPFAKSDLGADYAVVIGPGATAEVMVRASNDPYLMRYADDLGYEAVDADRSADGNRSWNVQRLAVNRPLVVPSTGEPQPAEVIEAGVLRFGTSDPADDLFDSNAAWNADGTVIEVRLPYQAIGFADPSSRLAYRVHSDRSITTEPVDRVGVTVAFGGTTHQTSGYSWEPWQIPTWHERVKVGAEVLTAALDRAAQAQR